MRPIHLVCLLFGLLGSAIFSAQAKVADGPWLDPANAEKYVFIGKDVWGVASGKMIAQGVAPFLYETSRPVANVSDRLWLPATEFGLAGMPGEGMLYSTTDDYARVHPTLNGEKYQSTGDFPGFWINADLRRAVWIEKGDFWRGTVDWAKGNVGDRQQVTKLGVFAGKAPVLWFGNLLFVNGGFDAAKPIVRIDLASGATEEIETYNVFNTASQSSYATAAMFAGLASPSACCLVNPTAQTIYTFDARSGKAGAIRNVLAGNAAVSSIPDVLNSGQAPAWLGDGEVVFVNAQSVVTKVNIEKQDMTVLFAPADRQHEHYAIKGALPGGKYMDIVVSTPGGQGEPPVFKERLLVDLASGKRTTTTLDADASNGKWLDDSYFVYSRKTGGLAKVGTWLYDRRTNESKRIAPAQLETTRMTLLRGGKEIWAVSSAGGVAVTRAKVDGSGSEELGASMMFPPLQFPAGPPVNLGLAPASAPVATAPTPPAAAPAPVAPLAVTPAKPAAPAAPTAPVTSEPAQVLYGLCWGEATGPSHTAYFSAPFEVHQMNQAGWMSAYQQDLQTKYQFAGRVRCTTAQSLELAKQRADFMRTQKWTVVETGWKFQ
jgi:hypothetical protein